MNVCGLKITHDGGAALCVDGRLVFSYEQEKVGGARRHSPLLDLGIVARWFAEFGLTPDDIDVWAVDGWWGSPPSVVTMAGGRPLRLPVAGYQDAGPGCGPLACTQVGTMPVGGRSVAYESSSHAGAHAACAYATSPFAGSPEGAATLVWDGGMRPRLYAVDGPSGELRGLGPLAVPQGDCYVRFAMQWPIFDAGPLAYEDERAHMSVAGKAMAYAGLGRCSPEGVAALRRVGPTLLDDPDPAPAYAAECRRHGITDADAIATFEEYIGTLLVEELGRSALRHGLVGRDLCLAGGCALNIKWNSAIRASGIFGHVWVPPFPNDAGSAIGAACAALMRRGSADGLDWTVYSGPGLARAGEPVPGWRRTPCSIEALAALLHERGEPVVFLSGRAELGPRALGARSIVAPATDPDMTRRLNAVKRREVYRPVAPICLEDEAEAVFAPGTADSYMLFAQRVRPGWAERIPAVVHVDGTARLQTVSPTSHPIGRLVAAYRALSGIPVLCNTSANRPGEGFFPGVEAATRWGEVPTVWSEGWLYERTTW